MPSIVLPLWHLTKHNLAEQPCQEEGIMVSETEVVGAVCSNHTPCREAQVSVLVKTTRSVCIAVCSWECWAKTPCTTFSPSILCQSTVITCDLLGNKILYTEVFNDKTFQFCTDYNYMYFFCFVLMLCGCQHMPKIKWLHNISNLGSRARTCLRRRQLLNVMVVCLPPMTSRNSQDKVQSKSICA